MMQPLHSSDKRYLRLLFALVAVISLSGCGSIVKKTTQLSTYQDLPLVSNLQAPYPIILLHGLGQKVDVWRGNGTRYFSRDLGLKLGAELTVTNGRVNASEGSANAVGDFYVVEFSNPTDSVNAWRDELDLCVKFVLNATKAHKVVLIGYSMGGLAARAYLVKRLTDHHVKRLITVGTPHLGSAFAKAYNWKTGFQRCLQTSNIAVTPVCKTALSWLVATESDVRYDAPAIRDLRRPEDGGEFLRRLNIMSHPLDIEYVSVVGSLNMFDQAKQLGEGAFQEMLRKVISVVGSDLGEMFRPGDGVVSAESQDITNIEYFKLNAGKQRAARTVGLGSLHVEHLQQSIEVQRIALDEKPEFIGARFVLKNQTPTLVVEFSDYTPRLCTLIVTVKQGSRLLTMYKTTGTKADLLLSPTGIIAQHCIPVADLGIEQDISDATLGDEPITFYFNITNSFGYAAASYLSW